MTLQFDALDLADRDDFPVDEWTLDEFDDLDDPAALDSVRSSITASHAFDDH